MSFFNHIKYALKHMKNKKKYSVVSFVVLMFGMLLMAEATMVFSEGFETILWIEDNFDNTDDLYIIEQSYNGNLDLHYMKNIGRFFVEIREKYPVFSKSVDNLSTDIKSEKTDSLVKIDNELLEGFGIRDENNNKIELNCFSEYKELAVGYNLKNRYKIGDKITNEYTKEKFVVKQYIAQGNKIFGDELYSAEKINLDDVLVTGYTVETTDEFSLSVLSQYNYLICNRAEYEKYEGELKNLAEKYNVCFSIKDYKEYRKDFFDSNRKENSCIILLFIIMSLTVASMLLIVSMVLWLGDGHDIGVMKANGFLQKDIFVMILIENAIRFLIPDILCYPIISSVMSNDVAVGFDDSVNIVKKIYIVISLVYLMETVIASIICNKILKRNSSVKLIRGESL